MITSQNEQKVQMRAGGSKLPFLDMFRMVNGECTCTSPAAITCVVLALDTKIALTMVALIPSSVMLSVR